jgi:primosomal protein N' (replication factor Y)
VEKGLMSNQVFCDIIPMGDRMVAHVLVELKAKGMDQTFTYHIPSFMHVEVGMRVLVPFGKQMLEGFVLKIEEEIKTDFELKDIIQIIDEKPVLNEELLKLGKYISRKTLCNLISAYQTMLPSALKAKNNFTVPKKYKTYLSLNMSYEEALEHCKNESQRQIIETIGDLEISKEEIKSSSVKTLLKNGILKETKKEVYRLKKETLERQEKLVLTEEQQKCVNEILNTKTYQPFLLHGVTGSGKTEVYMQLIESVLKEGKSAILLVPEISLTPQVTEKFIRRFKENIAILHSKLSNGEKYDEWRRIERGEVDIVIGARSAVFAPLTNLGIVIVDEEHSTTYKQENTPKYHAIDMALFRGQYHNIPVVLGSATPSIESYTKALLGKYKLLELKKRVNASMPFVYLVNMKEEIKRGNTILSENLKDKIIDRLEKKEQVILLLNKRGYTRVITCPSCGYQDKCPYCDIPLTYHKTSNMMRCHYCGYGRSKKQTCPECGSNQFRETGMGTEKLEEYILENIPGAKVLRMDVDTTSKKGSHEKLIHAFENKEANILLGTQMIAKGLDFKDVTLVGVLNGDASLNIPDFRSAERTYQLLSQVAGRAGRSANLGEVVIQGFNIDHYSILYAKEHNYEAFYKEEMKIRKVLKYSPYYNLTLIKLKGKDMHVLFEEGNKIVSYLKSQKLEDTFILGPSTSMIPKINNIFSVQILLKYKNSEATLKVLKEIQKLYIHHKISVDIDINPILM